MQPKVRSTTQRLGRIMKPCLEGGSPLFPRCAPTLRAGSAATDTGVAGPRKRAIVRPSGRNGWRSAMAAWQIEGQYMETCNCSFLCPCITSNLTAPPTEGDCKAAIAMRIDKGQKDGVTLDGIAFIVVMHAPKAMAEGNITVGLIIDERATDKQADAVTAVATGAAGGPMAALAPLVGRMAGVEKRAISFKQSGMTFDVTASRRHPLAVPVLH
ncbi:MAG: DUF1326 domain-containing protein [Rhodospirillaceae bacterium]|nr:DUF1326 domain-containing protein [Rhodospirillaceae bacterium]